MLSFVDDVVKWLQFVLVIGAMFTATKGPLEWVIEDQEWNRPIKLPRGAWAAAGAAAILHSMDIFVAGDLPP